MPKPTHCISSSATASNYSNETQLWLKLKPQDCTKQSLDFIVKAPIHFKLIYCHHTVRSFIPSPLDQIPWVIIQLEIHRRQTLYRHSLVVIHSSLKCLSIIHLKYLCSQSVRRCIAAGQAQSRFCPPGEHGTSQPLIALHCTAPHVWIVIGTLCRWSAGNTIQASLALRIQCKQVDHRLFWANSHSTAPSSSIAVQFIVTSNYHWRVIIGGFTVPR